jgi:hypothetical protein
MNQINFNPIEFLGLGNLQRERQEELLPKIWQHMAYYLITRFLEELPDDKYLEVEKKVKEVKGYEEVINLIGQYIPDFEVRKLGWLEEYRNKFDISLMEE